MEVSQEIKRFTYKDGYTLAVKDIQNDGVLVSLEHPREGAACIIVPTEKAHELARFLWELAGFPIWRCERPDVIAEFKKLCKIARADMINPDKLLDWRFKKSDCVRARHIIAFLLHIRHGLGYAPTGRLMGGNHASVILAVRRFGRISGNRIGWYKNATVEAAYRTAKKSLEKN